MSTKLENELILNKKKLNYFKESRGKSKSDKDCSRFLAYMRLDNLVLWIYFFYSILFQEFCFFFKFYRTLDVIKVYSWR